MNERREKIMAGNFGRNIQLDGNNKAEPMGACTPMCPAACTYVSAVLCKCTNNVAKNKGSSYHTKYLEQVHS